MITLEDGSSRLPDDRHLADFIERGWSMLFLQPPLANDVQAAYAAAADFFALPVAAKTRASFARNCGYRPEGVEYSKEREQPDAIESFTASRLSHGDADLCEIEEARILHGRLLDLLKSLDAPAREMAVSIARACGIEKLDAVLDSIGGQSCVQVNHATPASSPAEFIHLEHEDGHFLTFANATTPGLEVARRSGGFQSLDSRESFVGMPGSIACLMSGGLVQPLVHRVRNNRMAADRYALLCFVDLSPDLCRPWISNASNVGVDIARRVRGNPARFGIGLAEESDDG